MKEQAFVSHSGVVNAKKRGEERRSIGGDRKKNCHMKHVSRGPGALHVRDGVIVDKSDC